MERTVHVIAVQGTALAVLSELVWGLRQEGLRIGAIEVWTTAEVTPRLRDFLCGPAWRALEAAVGELPALDPEGTPPGPRHGLRVHVVCGADGQPLADVRSAADAQAMIQALHDRVLQLREDLPPHWTLVGSLAGGRKTMSAALQTAFALQGRAKDRLVHVLLHPALESWLAGRRDYAFPTPESEGSGVPMGQQIILYDVPFPRLRYLVPVRMAGALGQPWAKVWPVLEANLGTEARAELVLTGGRWSLVLRGAQVKVALRERRGAVLAALVTNPGASRAEQVAWLTEQHAQRPLLWVPPRGSKRGGKPPEDAFSQGIGALREVLKKELPLGFERYIPDEKGRIEGTITVVWS